VGAWGALRSNPGTLATGTIVVPEGIPTIDWLCSEAAAWLRSAPTPVSQRDRTFPRIRFFAGFCKEGEIPAIVASIGAQTSHHFSEITPEPMCRGLVSVRIVKEPVESGSVKARSFTLIIIVKKAGIVPQFGDGPPGPTLPGENSSPLPLDGVRVPYPGKTQRNGSF
jgi:hypothetical protein